MIGLPSLEQLAVSLKLCMHRLYPLIILGPAWRFPISGEALIGKLCMKAGLQSPLLQKRLYRRLMSPLRPLMLLCLMLSPLVTVFKRLMEALGRLGLLPGMTLLFNVLDSELHTSTAPYLLLKLHLALLSNAIPRSLNMLTVAPRISLPISRLTELHALHVRQVLITANLGVRAVLMFLPWKLWPTLNMWLTLFIR